MTCWHMQLHDDDVDGWDIDDIKEILNKGLIGCSGGPVSQFNSIEADDLILVRHGGDVIALVQALEAPRDILASEKDEFIWFNRGLKVSVLKYYTGKAVSGKGWYLPKTLMSVDNPIAYNYINELYKETKMETLVELLKSQKNLILTGAPGTGKTYLSKELARKLILPSSLREEVLVKTIDSFLNMEIDIKELEKTDDAWVYWKGRILANDFNLDDFANTQSNISDTEKVKYGYYLMNFLERRSAIYGSSKPGNAFNYGIKMNNDNNTYTIYDNKDERVSKEIAVMVFDEKIKPWLQQIVKLGMWEKIGKAEEGHELIRAGQLIRKLIVLDHPAEFLSIYQDATISKAYKYFLPEGSHKTYFEQNYSLLEFLLKKYKLERTKENQIRLWNYIWTYFNADAKGLYNIDEEQITERYLHEHYQFVQFHPSYDYTDFVEGLRPVKKENDVLGFELKNGIFKQFCKKAASDKSAACYVMIIDEINRAEISKVFGELFFSIDPGYRGINGKTKTQYANIQNKDTAFINEEDDWFYVPENVYIIGTMNDIDRSVESFDFAMRRRFAWKEITAYESMGMWDGTIDLWKQKAFDVMSALNEAIEQVPGLNSSYHIGPAYFLKLNEYKGDFAKLWQLNINPLLKEYLRGMPNADVIYTEFHNAYKSKL